MSIPLTAFEDIFTVTESKTVADIPERDSPLVSEVKVVSYIDKVPVPLVTKAVSVDSIDELSRLRSKAYANVMLN